MKSILKLLAVSCAAVSFSAEIKAVTPKEWGGFYSKFSVGYGEPNIKCEGFTLNTDLIPGFFKKFSASARLIGYDYELADCFAIGAEAGLTYLLPDSRSRTKSSFLLKANLYRKFHISTIT